MAYEQRDNSGSIFKNDRKEKDTHPDRAGTAMIDGVMYYVSGWLKDGTKGQFLSLAFKRKDQPAEATLPTRQRGDGTSISERAMPKGPAKRSIIPDDDMDGDLIPF